MVGARRLSAFDIQSLDVSDLFRPHRVAENLVYGDMRSINNLLSGQLAL